MLLFDLLVFRLFCYRGRNNIFENFIYSITLGVLTLFLLTEILSVFKAITFIGVLLSWGIINVVLLCVNLYYAILKRTYLSKSIWMQTDRCLLLLILLSVPIFYVAFTIVPINFDSMTYHLSRLVFWSQNHSVQYYATHTLRQLTSPMLAEYIMLHYYIIFRTDYFVNLVQAFSYVTNVVIIYNIVKKLGGKPFYCFFASFIFMTTPIALAESVTTQNDEFASVWVLIFIYVILDYISRAKIEVNAKCIFDVFVLGISMAFGYLAKPSVCIEMLFFLCWLLAVCILRKESLIDIIKCCVISSATALILLLPMLIRNYKMMGAFTAHITGQRQLVGTINPRYLIVNFLKNTTYNLPNPLDPKSSKRIYDFIIEVSRLLKVELNNPAISEDGGKFLVHSAYEKGMDTAVNFVFMFLFFAMILVVAITIARKRTINKLALQYCVTSTASFLCFLVVLRWEPYICRYMISYIAALSVAIGIWLQQLSLVINKHLMSVVVLIIVMGCCFETITTCLEIGEVYNIYDTRDECYFTLNHDYYDEYRFAADYITENDFKKIGYISAENFYDYAFYKLMDENIEEYRHVGVKLGDYIFNDSYIYEDKTYVPDCIFVIASQMPKDHPYNYNGVDYNIVYIKDDGWISLLVKSDLE